MATGTALTGRIIAAMLGTRWLMRLPIGLYRAGWGWMLSRRLVMIEHLGRRSHEPRYVVVEVVDRQRNRIRVASGFGSRAQWYRNLRANGVAYLSTGRARRVPAAVRLMDAEESAEILRAYAAQHPDAWEHLDNAMAHAQGGDPEILIVEFTPPR